MSLWGSLLLVLIFSGEVKGRVGTHVLGFVLDLETEDEDRMEAEYKVFSSPSFLVLFHFFFISFFSFSFFCMHSTFLPAFCKVSRILSLIILGFGWCGCRSYCFS